MHKVTFLAHEPTCLRGDAAANEPSTSRDDKSGGRKHLIYNPMVIKAPPIAPSLAMLVAATQFS
jgi:hypothetical protein